MVGAGSCHANYTHKNILQWANELNAVLEAKLKQQDSLRAKQQERIEKLETANASLREELESLRIERAYIEVKPVSVLQYEVLMANFQIEEGEIIEHDIYRVRFESEKREWTVRWNIRHVLEILLIRPNTEAKN